MSNKGRYNSCLFVALSTLSSGFFAILSNGAEKSVGAVLTSLIREHSQPIESVDGLVALTLRRIYLVMRLPFIFGQCQLNVGARLASV